MRLRSAALVADGTALATIEVGQVELWDARSGRRISRLVDPRESASGVAVTPDGARAVTVSRSGIATLLDVRSGRRIRSLPARGGQPLDRVVIDARGALAAVAGNDGTIRTYRLPSGTFAAPLIGHLLPVTAMSFTPDGSLLATASRDGSARVWEAATGRGLAVLRAGSEPVETVSFSPDAENRFPVEHDPRRRRPALALGRRRRSPCGRASAHVRPAHGGGVRPLGTADPRHAGQRRYADLRLRRVRRRAAAARAGSRTAPSPALPSRAADLRRRQLTWRVWAGSGVTRSG